MAFDSRRGVAVMFNGDETWEYFPLSPASYQIYGAGCAGAAGVPALAAAPFNLPWLGDTFQVELQNLPANAPTSLLIGASSSQWGALMLPFDLGVIGMPGCTLFSSGEAWLGATANGGTATFGIPLALPSLVGGTFYSQGFVLDPGANSAGVVASNAARGTVGAR